MALLCLPTLGYSNRGNASLARANRGRFRGVHMVSIDKRCYTMTGKSHKDSPRKCSRKDNASAKHKMPLITHTVIPSFLYYLQNTKPLKRTQTFSVIVVHSHSKLNFITLSTPSSSSSSAHALCSTPNPEGELGIIGRVSVNVEVVIEW